MKKLVIFDFRFSNTESFPRGRNDSSRANPQSPIANRKSPIANSTSGMALVITLSLIVLVTITAMAFFARATSNRVIEASRSNAVLAEQLGKTGADYATSIFLQEIVANSTTNTTSGVTIYNPTAATNIIPQRLLPSGITSTDTNFSNPCGAVMPEPTPMPPRTTPPALPRTAALSAQTAGTPRSCSRGGGSPQPTNSPTGSMSIAMAIQRPPLPPMPSAALPTRFTMWLACSM